MHPFTTIAPRTQAISVFEAAGRLGSFTAAGRELGLSQPAVTQHVRTLEAALGFNLFSRSANRVELTRQGREFLVVVTESFDRMANAVESLRGQRSTFVLAANPGFAQRWLVPHLVDLQSELADVDVRLWLFDRDDELARTHFDAAIHMSESPPPNTHALDLFSETVVPLASPHLARELELDHSSLPSDLPHDRLLHLDAADRTWMTWTDWFAGVGGRAPDGPGQVLYNNHALLMQDIVAGRGVGLGWDQLHTDLVNQGLVVKVGPEVSRPDSAYRLLWPDSTAAESIDAIHTFFQSRLAEEESR